MFSAIFPKKLKFHFPPQKKAPREPGYLQFQRFSSQGFMYIMIIEEKNQFLLISVFTSPPEIKRFGLYFNFHFIFIFLNTERCKIIENISKYIPKINHFSEPEHWHPKASAWSCTSALPGLTGHQNGVKSFKFGQEETLFPLFPPSTGGILDTELWSGWGDRKRVQLVPFPTGFCVNFAAFPSNFECAAQQENTALAEEESREPSWGIPSLDSTSKCFFWKAACAPSHNLNQSDFVQKNGFKKKQMGLQRLTGTIPNGAGCPAEFLWDFVPDILFAAPHDSNTVPGISICSRFGFNSHFPIISSSGCGVQDTRSKR